MKPSSRVTAAASALLVACLVGSVVLLQQVDGMRNTATLEEVLYISSPKALKRLSLGYNGLLADIYWTRAVQYFGEKHHKGAERYDLLGPLLEITTTLDPQLVIAYEYGSNFLAAPPPQGAGQPQKAIELVEFGIRNNPNEWRLYYDQGFIYYLELKEYSKAADAFSRGSKVPNAHPWLKLMAAQMAEHAGDARTARMMWTATYETTTDKAIRANAATHLRALQVDVDVTQLEALVDQYRQASGKLPASVAELIHSGLLRGVPLDPLGEPYLLTPDGRIEVRRPDDLPFIHKGLPPGYVPPKVVKFLPED